MRHPEIIQVAGVQTLDEIRVLLLVVNLGQIPATPAKQLFGRSPEVIIGALLLQANDLIELSTPTN